MSMAVSEMEKKQGTVNKIVDDAVKQVRTCSFRMLRSEMAAFGFAWNTGPWVKSVQKVEPRVEMDTA